MILSESSIWSYLFDKHHIIESGGLLLILAVIYIETGFFLGFVLPGWDYMLFAAGIFCGTHYLDIPLFWLVVLLITASFMGDFTGYFKGKWLGQKFFTDNKSHFSKKKYLGTGNSFDYRYANWSFNLGWFIPVIHTLVPLIAEYRSYQSRKKLILKHAYSIVWIGTLVPFGYFIGRLYRQIINHSAWVLVGINFIVSIPMLQILVLKK